MAWVAPGSLGLFFRMCGGRLRPREAESAAARIFPLPWVVAARHADPRADFGVEVSAWVNLWHGYSALIADICPFLPSAPQQRMLDRLQRRSRVKLVAKGGGAGQGGGGGGRRPERTDRPGTQWTNRPGRTNIPLLLHLGGQNRGTVEATIPLTFRADINHLIQVSAHQVYSCGIEK